MGIKTTVEIPVSKKYTKYYIMKVNQSTEDNGKITLYYFDEFKKSSQTYGNFIALRDSKFETYVFTWTYGTCDTWEPKQLTKVDILPDVPNLVSSEELKNVLQNNSTHWPWRSNTEIGISKEEFFNKHSKICQAGTPTPPTPTPQDPTDGTGTSCPTSGIYGGYGQKLADIKLFLYATNVTNGTIKLNKPQLEVGTVATDWRPNADEAIKHYTPAYKQVKGLAIQPGSNSKKYLEIPTVEGTIYGADLWGGDTAKLLKDEIAELKEQIKELKNQIK